MSEWQPIETAPKDGKAVLVVWPGNSVGIAWWKTNHRIRRDLGPDETAAIDAMGWQQSYFSGTSEMDDYDTSIPGAQPTHWMPLPEPPK